ncbi:hypothetical protein PUNSTDRAFT_139742 [Punctularia strigosozonata HHB-11173 SS5]|uniref:Uncharacterized protein n=1 Tax=Punctularia strigosozonata (strain HHB-11173) TaxID=741275 RepID=R7RYR7_PUNST|nr:uncharacterized protein PUNSTDRAFT_139742 [Punctularia strigosozonata HHB-11173 SS5]EIN03240.1 hypothetical protein PUNSTDRAFT_139742 [Punctularia strigosozonata HHB-11173 SS5]
MPGLVGIDASWALMGLDFALRPARLLVTRLPPPASRPPPLSFFSAPTPTALSRPPPPAAALAFHAAANAGDRCPQDRAGEFVDAYEPPSSRRGLSPPSLTPPTRSLGSRRPLLVAAAA